MNPYAKIGYLNHSTKLILHKIALKMHNINPICWGLNALIPTYPREDEVVFIVENNLLVSSHGKPQTRNVTSLYKRRQIDYIIFYINNDFWGWGGVGKGVVKWFPSYIHSWVHHSWKPFAIHPTGGHICYLRQKQHYSKSSKPHHSRTTAQCLFHCWWVTVQFVPYSTHDFIAVGVCCVCITICQYIRVIFFSRMQRFTLSLYRTVHSRYIPVIFLWRSHERHPIARPWGRGMGCRSWVRSLAEVLPL